MSAHMGANEYEKATQWREYSAEHLGRYDIIAFDPTHNSVEHFNLPASFDNGIIFQNYSYIAKSDVGLLNLDHFEDSIGSIWEVSMLWQQHKPVVAFGRCDKWQNRPHFKSLITVHVDTVEEACDYIASMYEQRI
jgi:nucleoside 2-deoxyribosyltransferase